RQFTGHGLVDHRAARLVRRWKDENVGKAVVLRQLALVDEAGEVNVAQAPLTREYLERLAQHAVTQEEERGARAMLHCLVRAQQRHRVLARDELGRVNKDDGLSGDAQPLAHRLALSLGKGTSGGEAIVVHGPRQQEESPRIGTVMPVV